MKTILGSKFPTVTEHESEQVKGAIDFIGLIITRHFTVKDKSSSLKQDLHVFNIDKAVELTHKLYDIVEYESKIYGSLIASIGQYTMETEHSKMRFLIFT